MAVERSGFLDIQFNPHSSEFNLAVARDDGTSPEQDWAGHPSRCSEAPMLATEETGTTGRIVSDSGHTRRSRGDRTGSAGLPVRVSRKLLRAF